MRVLQRAIAVVAVLAASVTQLQAGWTFTNAGATGTAGPTQGMVNSSYSATNLNGAVVVTGGIQQWVVPTTGSYTITAVGASGGSTDRAIGGRGASITIVEDLIAGQVINILVGQVGGLATFGGFNNGGETGGGGGGTFVVDQSNNPILVAGGGGGAAEGGPGGPYDFVLNGGDASAYSQTSGQNGSSSPGSWSVPGVGGINGQGGTKPEYGGAGGGGFLTNGQDSYFGQPYYAGEGGQSFLNGGLGGSNRISFGSFIQNIAGGFGGGAGAGDHENYESNAGGGGGYSGGGGGNTRVGAGGGGGNFYTGTYVSSGFNTGNGFVTFELNADAVTPEPASMTLLAMGGGLLAVGRKLRRRKIEAAV